MATVKEFAKKPIYRISDGKKLGDVKDLYLDEHADRVMAVFLGKEGLIKRKPLAIPLSRITVTGVDCWLAAEDTEPLDAREIDDGERYTLAADLRGRELQTSGGTRIGTIGDVVLDEGFRVTAFALSKVHVEGPVAEAKAVPRESVAELGDGKSPAVMDLEIAENA